MGSDMLIQVFLVISLILALIFTWKRFRQGAITLVEGIFWSLAWLCGIAITMLPWITERLADIFGVGRGVDLVLYSGVAILFFMVFKLFLSYEKLERLLTKMVQENALKDLPEKEQETK